MEVASEQRWLKQHGTVIIKKTTKSVTSSSVQAMTKRQTATMIIHLRTRKPNKKNAQRKNARILTARTRKRRTKKDKSRRKRRIRRRRRTRRLSSQRMLIPRARRRRIRSWPRTPSRRTSPRIRRRALISNKPRAIKQKRMAKMPVSSSKRPFHRRRRRKSRQMRKHWAV